MSLRLLSVQPNEAQFIHRIEIPVSYSALFVRITGTNGVTPATLRDIGRLRFSIRQQPVIDSDADYLAALQNLWYGTPEFVSTASGNFRFGLIIPRTFIVDKNVERVTKADAATFETSFTPTLFTNIASAFNAELYAVTAEGPQSYNLLMFQQAYPLISPSSNYVDDITTVENVCAAYISDIVSNVLRLDTSNIDRVRVRKGDMTVDASKAALVGFTYGRYAVETGLAVPATFDPNTAGGLIAELFGLDGSDLSSRLEDGYNLAIQTGGGAAVTPQILTIGFKPNPDRLGESAGEITDRLNRAKRMKASSGKTRGLTFIDTVAGA